MKFFKKKAEKEKLTNKEKKKLKKKKRAERIQKRIERKNNRKNHDLKPVIGGMSVGIANIIPGVSGGTMLVIFNLFDKLMYAISDIFKRKTETRKESFIFILKVLIGAAIGVVVFAKILGFTLKHCEAETIFWFVGLILFSVPLIVKEEMKNQKFNIIFFLIGVLIICILEYFNLNHVDNVTDSSMNLIHVLTLIGLGLIGGITMIFPGVSGSMVLLVLGKYEMIRSYVSDITKFDMNIYINLMIFGIGVILGIILSAKLLSFLLKKYKGQTMSLILGFIISSALILPLNIESTIKFDTQSICAISAAFILGGAVIYYIDRLQNKTE